MCQAAAVSRASFYRDWVATIPTEAEMVLRDAIQRLAVEHRYYGYRRITALLAREGLTVGVKVVRRLMRADNLLAIRRRKFKVTTDSDHPFEVVTNRAESLTLTAMDQLWVADFTYIRLGQEFVFLAVVLDAFSRRVLGWALSREMDAALPLLALERALAHRQPPRGWMHHSDRGTQYACGAYVKRLEAAGAVLSMSRPASPWENGRCESFIKTLKFEQLDALRFSCLAELNAAIEEFIEHFYNPKRLHSALGYRSPLEFEQAQVRPQTPPPQPAALSFRRHEEIYPNVPTPEG
jgi:putative transposase